MTAEQYVKNIYPSATCSRDIINLDGKNIPYWQIKIRGAIEPISVGKSESNAWKNAKDKIVYDQTI